MTSSEQPGVLTTVRDAFTRRPLVPAALLLILGTLLHRLAWASPAFWAGAATGYLVLALACLRVRWFATVALALAITAAGIAAAQHQAFLYPSNHITHFTTDARRLAHVELTIDQPPRILTASAAS